MQGAFSFGALVGFERSTVLQHPKYVYEKLQVCKRNSTVFADDRGEMSTAHRMIADLLR